MKTNQILGIAGGLAMAIGVFLPLVSMGPMSITCWDMTAGAPGLIGKIAYILLVLGIGTAVTGFMGGKQKSMISLACSALGLVLFLISTEFHFGGAGIGLWIIVLGCILGIAGGAMGMKSTN
jgi:hypothetical protein